MRENEREKHKDTSMCVYSKGRSIGQARATHSSPYPLTRKLTPDRRGYVRYVRYVSRAAKLNYIERTGRFASLVIHTCTRALNSNPRRPHATPDPGGSL